MVNCIKCKKKISQRNFGGYNKYCPTCYGKYMNAINDKSTLFGLTQKSFLKLLILLFGIVGIYFFIIGKWRFALPLIVLIIIMVVPLIIKNKKVKNE